MINEAMLICALSLSSPHFTRLPILMEGRHVQREYAELLGFIRQVYPDAEVKIIRRKNETEELKKSGWTRTPFRWRDHPVWIRRSA